MESWNYLKGFTKLLERTEVPPRFAIWCGLSSLLAAMERRVWINQGIYTIYPNFYMVLVAASGQKKSTAINTASRLLRKLAPGPNVVSQKITPEALISSLNKIDANENTKIIRQTAGGIVIADELATFLDKTSLDRGLGPLLTNLYDCTPFEYRTMKDGIKKIEDGYLSMLGGTTIELLKGCLPKDAIGGGFTSRTMFVYEEATPPPIAWIDYDEALVELENELVAYLQRIMELNGPVTLTPEAKEFFIADYEDRHRHGGFRRDNLLQSYENRRHAHLLKLSMAMMVSDVPTKVMELQHLRAAKIILEEAEEYLPRVVELIVSSDVGLAASMVYNYIAQRKQVSRAELVRQFSHKFDSQEISKFVDTLIIGKRIVADTAEGRLVYRAVEVRS